MGFWLVKTEPEDYAWEHLERDGRTAWTGVRNFQARNNLKEMKRGDLVFIYHTGLEKMIMGIARVIAEAVPDPTAEKGDWVSVDLEAVVSLTRVVSLEEIRNTYGLFVMPLVTQPRLSVLSVSDEQAETILRIAKTDVV